MNKTRLNYALDWVIALAFALSAITGLLLWLAGSGGFQGGRNAGFRTVVLGVSRWTWSDLHIWVSLVLVAGGVVHFLLHWDWVVCVTKRLLRPTRSRKRDAGSVA